MQQLEMQGILQGPAISDSPIQTSNGDFSATGSYSIMAPGQGYAQAMTSQGQDSSQYYNMSPDMQYPMASNHDQAFSQPTSAYTAHSGEEGESQHYHNAGYLPSHFYPPGSGQ